MSTYTAQILAGHPHQNHGGIEPNSFCQTFLSENDRPCWVMNEFGRRASATGNQSPQVRWIPESSSTILEDGLLLVALHGLRHEDLLAQAPREMTSLDAPLVRLAEVDAARLDDLRAACRKYDFGGKGKHVLILSVMSESTIRSQLSVIDHYRFDCEILTPKFCRSFSAWSGDTKVTGSLA